MIRFAKIGILSASLALFMANKVEAANAAHIDRAGNIYVYSTPEEGKNMPQIEKELQEGLEAFNNKKYDVAIPKLEKVAKYKNAKALNVLGLCYANGYGVSVDMNKAYLLLKEAATGIQPQALAMYALGDICLKSAQHEKNMENKIKLINASKYWYLEAAKNGHAYSQTVVAEYYYGAWKSVFPMIDFSGIIDYKKSAEWYEKAAQQGDANAQVGLADMYECGTGVEKNIELAKKWYTAAALQGNTLAKKHLLKLNKSTAEK